MRKTIDFWFSCGSTYSGLTILRLRQIEDQFDTAFNLRPFYLGAILDELGPWPYREGSPKTAYMWRDLTRRAQVLELNASFPVPYPSPNAVIANQVAHFALRQPWGRAYLEEGYKMWFEKGVDLGSTDNLMSSLPSVGQDMDEVLAQSKAAGTHEALIKETNEARRLGVFGAPTFSVGEDIFWGDDRLEDALLWSKKRQ